MLIAKIPRILSRSFKKLTWELPGEESVVYLSFDDGPTPEVTEWVLKQLDKYGAKGTFFCLGKNVKSNPGIFQKILSEGHSVGNHSYSHLKGFRVSIKNYVENVMKARELIDSPLFRPPYGRIRTRQAIQLRKQFRIVMWSVLSVDYDRRLSSETVVNNVISNVRSGSIIVFHDSIKASKNLYEALPKVLEYLRSHGFEMRAIPLERNDHISQ